MTGVVPLAFGIPTELTTAVLTALSIGGAWLATFLARRGQREDHRIAESNQTFTQLRELGEGRLNEINRLNAAIADERADKERVATAGEARWDRQMARCRRVTDSLVRAVEMLRTSPTADAEDAADAALLELTRHNEDDHHPDA